MGELARATELGRRFGDFTAVAGVDLTVSRGEIVGLLGANGAGKTTTIRLVLGLLLPTSGVVRHFGRPPSRATRARIGYVPQGLGLYDDLTADENLAFAAAVYHIPEPKPRELEPHVRDTLVGDLPLGYQRRVAFTEAFAHAPELLVLDEPTSGVEPLARARLWDQIHDVADGGAGILVTTHSMDEASQCDRLIVLSDGRVAASGTMGEIVGERTVIEVRSSSWADSYRALRNADLPASLVGTAVRVPGATAESVRAVLRAGGVRADLDAAPATFEEAFVALTQQGGE